MRFDWAQVGDQIEERYTLTNASPMPAVWVEVIDGSNLPDYQAGLVTGIEGRSTSRWHCRHVCTRRGLFTLGPTSLLVTDPLGFFKVTIHDPRSVTLMVTPPIVPLPQIQVAPGGRTGQGRPRPHHLERTVNAASVRSYTPGDDPRWIHWRTTARRDSLYLRTFDNSPSGDWWIILDMNQEAQAGTAPRSTEEHGVILAASLADRGLRLGRPTGLLAGGNPVTWIPPRQGDAQRWEILNALALIGPAHRSLNEILESLRPSLGSQASLVIITPDTSGAWLEALLPFAWQGAIPTLLVFDPAAFGGAGSIKPLTELAARWNFPLHPITPDLLDRPEAQPGRKGQWQWRISATGRAVALNPARETSWKPLQ